MCIKKKHPSISKQTNLNAFFDKSVVKVYSWQTSCLTQCCRGKQHAVWMAYVLKVNIRRNISVAGNTCRCKITWKGKCECFWSRVRKLCGKKLFLVKTNLSRWVNGQIVLFSISLLNSIVSFLDGGKWRRVVPLYALSTEKLMDKL